MVTAVEGRPQEASKFHSGSASRASLELTREGLSGKEHVVWGLFPAGKLGTREAYQAWSSNEAALVLISVVFAPISATTSHIWEDLLTQARISVQMIP